MPLIEELSGALRDFAQTAAVDPRRIYMTPEDERALARESDVYVRVFETSRFLGVPIKVTPTPAVQCWLDCAEWRVEVVQEAHTYSLRIGIQGRLGASCVVGDCAVDSLTEAAGLTGEVAAQLHRILHAQLEQADFHLPEYPATRQDFGPEFIAQLLQAQAGLRRQPDVSLRVGRSVLDPAGRWSAAESWLV